MQNRKDLYKQNLYFVFDSEKNHKPVYFHCHIGADRTGTLGVILEGLLGVGLSDLYKDYELTSFSHYDTHRYKENIDGILEYINTLTGETLTDKFYTYVHDEVGISAKDIADFRQKMLGTIYPTDVKNMIGEATTSLDLTGYTFEAEALTGNMPAASNLLVTVAPESGINGQNIINGGVCESLVLTDGKDFGTPDAFTATQASFTTSVKAYKTLVLPFEANVPEGFSAANLTSVSDAKINLEQVTAISPDSPVLIEGEGALELTATNATVAATGEAPANGILCGTYKATTAPLGSYVLQKQNDVIGFYHVEGEIEVSAFRAWLNAPISSVKVFYLSDDATGIDALTNETIEAYDLQGRKLSSKPAKAGIYIVNGKKVLY